MCTSSAFWLPSGCGIAALPRKVPSLMSAIEALTTATIIALSVSVSLSSAPSLDFKVRTLPSTFSMSPRTRRVCAVAAVQHAAMIAPASAIRIVLIMLFPGMWTRAIVAALTVYDSLQLANRMPAELCYAPDFHHGEKTHEKNARIVHRSGRCAVCTSRRYRGRQGQGRHRLRGMPRRQRPERERHHSQPRRAARRLPRGAAEGVQGGHAQGGERDQPHGHHDGDRGTALRRRHRQCRGV